MNIDIKGLEDKVSELIGLCVSLRAENQQLRDELNIAKQDTTKLKSNMLQASNQLEMLLDALPSQEGQK
jgi:cell division protein ZapB